jgi:MYXO-CTERM domain-containing protein
MFLPARRLACLAALIASGAAPARAQLTGTSLVATDFEMKLEKKVGDEFVLPNKLEADLFFNRARCECDTPVAIRVAMTTQGIMKRSLVDKGNVQLWAGPASCVAHDIADRPKDMTGCTKLADLPQLPDLFRGPHRVETTVSKLFLAGVPPEGKGCAAVFAQSLWLWVDADQDGSPDMALSASMAPTLAIAIDGEAPPAPTDVTLTPGNEALTVRWTRSTVMSDQNGFLVFCSRADMAVFNPSFFSGNEYQSQKTACPDKAGMPNPDESTAFNRLDPAFLCSELVTTASEWRIKILQNGIPYQVGVASVDTHGNASPITNVFVQAPVPTVGFYDAYRAAGGQASGCSYGGGSAGGAALLVLALGLGWRRRR